MLDDLWNTNKFFLFPHRKRRNKFEFVLSMDRHVDCAEHGSSCLLSILFSTSFFTYFSWGHVQVFKNDRNTTSLNHSWQISCNGERCLTLNACMSVLILNIFSIRHKFGRWNWECTLQKQCTYHMGK